MYRLALSLVVFTFSAAECVLAGTPDSPPAEGSHWKFDASYWYSDGDAGFKAGDFWGTFSALEYPLEGGMYEGRAEYRYYFAAGGMRAAVGVRGSYAQSGDLSGTSTDTDYDFFGFKQHYSESDNEGEATIWSADLMLLVRPFAAVEAGLLAGYGEHSYAFEDSDLHYEYEYGTDVGFVPGPVSTYDVDFTGPRVGVIGTVMPLARLSLSAEWIHIPALEAKADAVWMLRDYPFSQEAEGSGHMVKVTASYRLLENLDLFVGFRWVSLIAEDGTEDGILDGEYYEGEEIVEEITSEYVAAEIGASLRF